MSRGPNGNVRVPSGRIPLVKISHSIKGPTTKLAGLKNLDGLLCKLNEFDSESVYTASKRVPIHFRIQLHNCTDCEERDSWLFMGIEKITRTSLGRFRYKEIVYVVIIFF